MPWMIEWGCVIWALGVAMFKLSDKWGCERGVLEWVCDVR